MRFIAAFNALAALAILGGCARSRITTDIKANGSWVRTVAFTGQEKKEGQMIPSIEDTFAVPAGAGWTSNEGKKGDERTLTLERTMAPGRSLKGDLSIKGGDGPNKFLLTNEVTVTGTAPGRFEYREKLHWSGDPLKDTEKIKPEDVAEIKSALPKALATDENARSLMDKAAPLMIPVIFGPGDPLLAIGMFHPDLAERRASQRIGTIMLTALEQQFGDKLTPDERRDVARKLIKLSISSAKVSQPDMSAGPPDPSANKNSGGMTPLMFIVKAPGRVVSSNGEVDSLTGETYWALYPEAAALADVVLTAVVEVEKK
jgi:hypothetical protein